MFWKRISRKVTCLSELCGPLYTGCIARVTFLGIGTQSWWSFSPKATYKCETDSKQVPWGKHEKDFEKRVKSAWNCWTGSEWCLNAHDRLLPLRAALWVVAMGAHRCSTASVVLLPWHASALMYWSMLLEPWKLAGWACECFCNCLYALGVMVTLGMHLLSSLEVDPILVC